MVSIADSSLIVCDKIINATDSVLYGTNCTIPTNVTNTISTNVASTVSINSDYKKVRYKMDSYILHTVLLVIILLFITAIICYRYAKHSSNQKDVSLR